MFPFVGLRITLSKGVQSDLKPLFCWSLAISDLFSDSRKKRKISQPSKHDVITSIK